MAWFEQDKKSGIYRIRFRFPSTDPKQHRTPKEFKIRDEDAANAKCVEIDETIRLVERGVLTIPEGVDPVLFISSGGKVTQRPVYVPPPEAVTLKALFDAYIAERSDVGGREGTILTENIHIAHLKELLGEGRDVASIGFDDIQGYATERRKQRWRGEAIQRETIEKELATFAAIWRWGMRRGMVGAAVPWRLKDLTLPFSKEKPPFRTYEFIREKIDRGGLSEKEQARLWGSLYLTGEQVAEVLDHVASRGAEPFVYPMFAFVALTGARRGELLRSEIDDFDFKAGSVTIRGTKGRKKTQIVPREVHIHERLRDAMQSWFARHPGGQITLCRDDGRPLGEGEAKYHFRHALKGSKWAVIKGFHVFRHSTASILASNGVDQRYIDKYLGHHTEEMKRRYQHLFPTKDKRPIDFMLV